MQYLTMCDDKVHDSLRGRDTLRGSILVQPALQLLLLSLLQLTNSVLWCEHGFSHVVYLLARAVPTAVSYSASFITIMNSRHSRQVGP